MIKQTLVTSLMCGWALVVIAWVVPISGAQEPTSFARDIQPILQGSCWTCHGELQTSGLDLRTREGALKGGDSGAAIIPGKADQSRLYRRIAGLEQPSMPLDGTLTAQQVALIKAWIDQGAHWDLAAAEPAAVPTRANA